MRKPRNRPRETTDVLAPPNPWTAPGPALDRSERLPMNPMQRSPSAERSWLHRKLGQLEILAEQATTEGERLAATRARERVRQHLEDLQDAAPSSVTWDSCPAPPHWQFQLPDEWSRCVLLAVLHSHDLQPYRRGSQRALTVCVQAPSSLIRERLWPDYRDQAQALYRALTTVADRFLAVVFQKRHTAPPAWKWVRLKPPRRVSPPRGPTCWL